MATPRKTTTKTSSSSTSAPAATPAVSPARSEVKGSGSSIKAPASRTFTHDQIAQRAYQIYASRGYTQGNPNDDWAEAERQLRAGL